MIIGGGGAGLAAAVAAAEEGASNVIVLEKLGFPGGNTAMSSGMFAAESLAQKRAAIDARREVLFKILTEFAHWKVNPRIVRAFIDKSGDTIRWLEDKGLVFDVLPMYPNQSPPTWHQARGNRGAEVVKVLAEECRKLGVKVLTSTSAKKIITGTKGNVTGVVAESKGDEFTITAKSVIIATGGYGGNKELLKKYSPAYRDNMLCDGLLHTGDGLIMAMEIGAATEGLGLLLMSGPQIPGSVLLYWGNPPDIKAAPLMAIALEPNTVWVNKNGERIADEAVGYNHYTSANAVNRQPDNLCYTLLDQKIVQTMEEEGLIIGLGRTRFDQRTKMPGLERELRIQTQGLMSIEQVDHELCNGCGICVNSCPVGAIDLDTVVADKGEFSPCRFACPAGVDMRRYLYLLRIGRVDEANNVLREFLPLPAVTGRVCPHPCEAECARNEVDEAVNINSLERFVADYWLKEKAQPVPKKYTAKTAIIGSGPAGLACAYFLTRMGYPVTVFEAMPVLGGMLRMGIPEYRLPKKVLDAQINYIRDMGVEFKTGVTIGKDITFEKLKKDYQAIFFATGNQLSRRIELEGGELDGVLWGLDFLRDVNLENEVKVKDKVVVIGGGNVAMDVALTALRLGAEEVQLACLESGDKIPAYKEEIEQAVAEGVSINEGWGPQRILGDGKMVTGIELVRCTKVFDAKGKFNPSFDKKTTKTLKADMVILAIGQAHDFSLAPKSMKITENGTVQIDPITLETSLPGIFAGGDVVTGAASVVKAIADGNTAAVSIDRYLRGEDLKKGRSSKPEKVKKPPQEGIPKMARMQTLLMSVDNIAGNFEEVKLGFNEDTAKQEVQRCLTCGSRAILNYVDDCRICKSCEINCPVHAIYVAPVKKIEPHVKISDSWDEIAKWMEADPQVLKTTIDKYNAGCDQGYDPIFAKDRKFLVPLRTPPYYAIKSNSDFLDTIGGIKINEPMEVLDKQGKPIPGLYAAGVAAGGWQGDTYCVVLSGAASGFAINSGRIAGENAFKFALGLK